MKIRVVVTDLRDDAKYEVTIESWETLAVVRQLLAKKIPNAPPEAQYFYVTDSQLNLTMPAEQLRKAARAVGLLTEEDESADPRVARVFVYVGKPIDFSDMMMDDIVKKLRRDVAGEVKQIFFRIVLREVETKLSISVNSALITVDDFKDTIMKQMGPQLLTGLKADKLLLYERGVQPGGPLQGNDLQGLFGTKFKVDVDGQLINDPVTLRVIVKKWGGMVTVEQHDLTIYDHELVEDLKAKVCNILRSSPNPSVAQKNILPYTVELSLAGISLGKKGSLKLLKKYGIPATYLWLRAFDVKNKTPVVVYL